jgi:hypothetical protein
LDYRKPPLDEEGIEILINALVDGNRPKVAADLAGISEQMFYIHMRNGRKLYEEWSGSPEGILRELNEFEKFAFALYTGVTRAMAEAQANAVSKVKRGMDKDWHAAKFHLEATDPENWKPKDQVEVQHSGEVKVIFKMPKRNPQAEENIEEIEGKEVQGELNE